MYESNRLAFFRLGIITAACWLSLSLLGLAGSALISSCATTARPASQTKHTRPAYRRSAKSGYEAEPANPRYHASDWHYTED